MCESTIPYSSCCEDHRSNPNDEQPAALKQTIERANAACNYISALGWQHRNFRRYSLQNLCYSEVREKFALSAQMVIHCLAKVADAYQQDRKKQRTFRAPGSVAYDDRILSWQSNRQTVSIWTVAGRQRLSYAAGERQCEYLQYRQGESDLLFANGMFLAVCEIPEPEKREVTDALDVDLGVTNIATTSDGEMQTSAAIERRRRRMVKLRGGLQSQGSLSAKRHLRKLAGKQHRFQKDFNHRISKRLVSKAERTRRAIALEELKGIRAWTRVSGRENRASHSL